MPQFNAPIADIKFLLEDVFDHYGHYEKYPAYSEATPDLVDVVVSECAKFCENELFPLNQSGDKQGCKLEDGQVTTPDGFKEAYQQFVEGGWQGLSHPLDYGGQGLPQSIGVIKSELTGTANWSWAMYPGLSLGAMNTILAHGSEAQKDRYMPPLTEGTWTGTMCLTEAHCGTDLGLLRTRAEPQAKTAAIAITGTRRSLSAAGDHDYGGQHHVHIVLARLPDAPEGTQGISLFIVPKYRLDATKTAMQR